MKCKQAQKLLSPFLDRELSEAQMSSIEEHVVICFECRTDLEMQRRLWAALGSVEPVFSPDLTAAVEARLSERSGWRAFLNSLWPRSFGYAMATAALVGLFVWTGVWTGTIRQASAGVEQERPFAELLTDTPPGMEVVALLDQIENSHEN